jgi:uncharacterized damage-inducible protein DinB
MDDRELFAHWDAVRVGLGEALGKLGAEQLRFTPREGLRTIGEVVCHIAGTEEDWLRAYPLGRWGEANYQPEDYPTAEALAGLLAAVHERTAGQLGAGAAFDLGQQATLPWGATVSWRWAVWHVIEHEIHHRGEIYLMLGLLGIEAPDV